MTLEGTPKYALRLKELQDEAKNYTVSEVGYVEISKIVNATVFGIRKDNGKNIGPIEVDTESAKLIKPGDVINMISVRKKKGGNYYEICELGYVYPRSFR